MPLDKSNSEADRIRARKERIIYSNYLGKSTLFNNGLTSRAPLIVAGTGASIESSSLYPILDGEVIISPADQSLVLTTNAAPTVIPAEVIPPPPSDGFEVTFTNPTYYVEPLTFTIDAYGSEVTFGKSTIVDAYMDYLMSLGNYPRNITFYDTVTTTSSVMNLRIPKTIIGVRPPNPSLWSLPYVVKKTLVNGRLYRVFLT